MYENSYREYLDNKRWYQQHLENRGEPQYAHSFAQDLFTAAGIVGGGYVAFERGALKGAVQEAIRALGRFRGSRAEALSNAFRALAEHPTWNQPGNQIIKSIHAFREAPEIFKTAFRDYETKLKSMRNGPFSKDHGFELTDALKEMEDVLKRHHTWTKNKTLNDEIGEHDLNQIMVKKIREEFEIKAEEDAKRRMQTGHGYATVEQVFDHLHPTQQNMIRTLETKMASVDPTFNVRKHLRMDKNLLHDGRNFSDLRPFRESFGKFMDSFANEFGIPLVNFNPVKLLYLNNLTSTKRPPMFALLHPNSRNPLVTGHNGYVGAPLFYAHGDVYNLINKAEMMKGPIATDTYLTSAKEGTVARLIRNLSGIPIKTFQRPTEGFWNKLRYDVADFFDIGFQDAPIRRYRDDDGNAEGVNLASGLSDLFSLGADKLFRKFPIVPKSAVKTDAGHLDQAFGGKDAEWLIMRSYHPIEKSNSFGHYMEQFYATRTKLQDVTTGTLYGYAFFERLNAALESMGLGLSVRHMGSGFDVAKNLIFKRMVPIAVGAEVFKNMDYVSQFVLGEPFTHRFAEFYRTTSIDLAGVRDNLGITDWAKSWAGVFPGGDQISELPVVGNLVQLNKDQQETRDYWDEGVDPVRKGRYWDLGNTAFTGGQVEYYRPNWVRRTLADVDYSDNTYGSREEYLNNSWLPSVVNPLAPIRHFITDPYWYERKHYQDRPYLVTGGIDQLKELPVIGGLLNQTVGQILKPQKWMHQDWKQEQAQEDSLKYSRNTVDSVIPAVIDPGNNVATYNAAIQAAGGTSVKAPSTQSYHTDTSLGYAAVPINLTGNANVAPLPNQPDTQTIAYTTSGGDPTVMQLDPSISLYDLNQKIKDKGIQRTGKVTEDRLKDASPDVASLFAPPADPMDPVGIQSTLGNLYYNMSDVGGIYGFGMSAMTGELWDQAPVVQDSSRATSYERAFWDQDIGGIGGEANEIFRRFLPHRRHQIDEYNPIRNTMPSWMPGSDYYIDFQHGDPYVKVKVGEERLPGDAYQKLWNLPDPMKMSIGASFIGKDQESIIRHFLKRDELNMEDSEDILTYGEKFHKQMQNQLTSAGIMINYEQKVEDKHNNINGFYDGLVHTDKFEDWAKQNAGSFNIQYDPTKPYTDQAIIEMKTMSDKAFHSGEIKPEHMAQVNFYMGQKGLNRGYLVYFNRDNPDEAPAIRGYDFSPELYKQSLANVDAARATIRRMMNNGVIGPADMYPMLDRLRILGDVAPYSNEYRSLRDQIGKMDLSDEDKKKIQEIRHHVAERKKFTRMYDYRFLHQQTRQERVHVTQVIQTPQSYMFLTREHPDNPIKMAGIHVPMAKDDPIAKKAHAKLDALIHPGASLNIIINDDDMNLVNNDTYKTISAVVAAGPIKNLNQELMKQGLAKENDKDDSPAGIVARYTNTQRAVGRVWEMIAHADTIFNTKWLQVRSPYESYERREVYGKDWQNWETPVESFLKPAWWSLVHGGTIGGGTLGALLGFMVGKTRYAKLLAGTAGALIGLAAGGFGDAYKAATGHQWVPVERQHEWDVNQYMDTIRYVKDQRLMDKYAEKALQDEHFNVLKYIQMNKAMGEKRKAETHKLEQLKRELRLARESEKHKIRRDIRNLIHYEGENGPDDKDLLRALNAKIQENANMRRIQKIGPNTAKALQYYKDSQQTLYGYEPGGPLEDVLAALPKKDREYLLPFMEAPKDERLKILNITPPYLRRVLEASWGLPVENKESLTDYFQHHELPNANWVGWDQRVNLDDVKVKIVQKEALDQSEFDIWPDETRRTDREYIRTPNVYTNSTVSSVKSKLEQVLGKTGIDDLEVLVEKNKSGRIDVNMQLQKDRRQDVLAQLNENGMSMFQS